MTTEEIKQYLNDNLSIEVLCKGAYVKVILKLEGEEISSDTDYIQETRQ